METENSEIKRAKPESEPPSSPVLRSDVATPGNAEGPGAERRGAPPASGLPCLNSNNEDGEDAKQRKLQGMGRKVAFALTMNVQAMIKEYGVERIGFLTLTFPDHVTDPRECNRRFGNLRRRALSRYPKWIAVRERQESSRLHLHLLVVVAEDIQTGVSFQEIANHNYRTAGPYLRAEWAFWRKAAKNYGFGRTELLPIKSNAAGVARYVGKYIQKNLDCRISADKGARLVSYSKGAGQVRANGFAWNSPRAWLWRKKVAQVADKCGILEYDELKQTFGSRWAWSIQKRVFSEELSEFPSGAIARADGHCVPHDATDVKIVRSPNSVEYWENNLDEWLALCQKDMAFARLKRDREFFTPESEAEFNRRAAESERARSIYPPATPESYNSEFDEVIETFPSEQPF
jgi:hypothetical protein